MGFVRRSLVVLSLSLAGCNTGSESAPTGMTYEDAGTVRAAEAAPEGWEGPLLVNRASASLVGGRPWPCPSGSLFVASALMYDFAQQMACPGSGGEVEDRRCDLDVTPYASTDCSGPPLPAQHLFYRHPIGTPCGAFDQAATAKSMKLTRPTLTGSCGPPQTFDLHDELPTTVLTACKVASLEAITTSESFPDVCIMKRGDVACGSGYATRIVAHERLAKGTFSCRYAIAGTCGEGTMRGDAAGCAKGDVSLAYETCVPAAGVSSFQLTSVRPTATCEATPVVDEGSVVFEGTTTFCCR